MAYQSPRITASDGKMIAGLQSCTSMELEFLLDGRLVLIRQIENGSGMKESGFAQDCKRGNKSSLRVRPSSDASTKD